MDNSKPIGRVVTLPAWMQPTFPITAYILRQATPRSHWLWRAAGGVLGWLVMVAGLFGSFTIYTAGGYDDLFLPGEFVSFIVLYFPVLFLQVAMTFGAYGQVAILGLSAPGTPLDAQRDTWELAKVTSHGPELVTRGRWAALLYRLRGMIALLVLVRIGFSAQVLVDLALSWDEFGGVVAEHAPGVPVGAAALLVGALLLAQIVLSVTTAGLVAAFGLLLATAFRRQWMVRLAQQIGLAIMIALFGTGLFTGWGALNKVYDYGLYRVLPGGRGVLAMELFGDQGWRLTSLDIILELIARVEYGIWLAGPVLLLALLEWGAIRWMLRQAVRFAALPDRE